MKIRMKNTWKWICGTPASFLLFIFVNKKPWILKLKAHICRRYFLGQPEKENFWISQNSVSKKWSAITFLISNFFIMDFYNQKVLKYRKNPLCYFYGGLPFLSGKQEYLNTNYPLKSTMKICPNLGRILYLSRTLKKLDHGKFKIMKIHTNVL